MSTALATLTNKLASKFDMGESGKELITVLKQTAFRGNATDSQLTALLIVANEYGLNPWTKEIYAFPDRNNGIVPVVGIDGWSRIINDNPNLDGIEFEYGPQIDGGKHHEWIECVVYRKDRSRPIKAREFWHEVYRKGVGPWESHGNRMHRHKAMIQCSRIAFGYTGIYDQDEAERFVEPEKDITPRTAVVMPQSTKAPAASPQASSEQMPPFDHATGEVLGDQPGPMVHPEEQDAARQVEGEPTATEGQLKVIRAKLDGAGLGEQELATAMGVPTIAAIPASRVNEALNWVKNGGAQ